MPDRIEETTTEARQGDGRKMNLRVLLISLVGILAVFALVYMIFFATAPAGV
jgi:flagellar basal body-associated protein FliL